MTDEQFHKILDQIEDIARPQRLEIQAWCHKFIKSKDIYKRLWIICNTESTHLYTIKCMQNDPRELVRIAVRAKLAGEDYKDCNMADFFEIAGADTESKRIRLLSKLNGCNYKKLNAQAKARKMNQ